MLRNNKTAIASLIAAALLSTSAMAEEEKPSEDRLDESEKLSIVWVNPKEFTDVRPSSEGRKSFRNRTMKDLHQYLDKLAADLPDGHKLKFSVTDLDLAGRVWPATALGSNNGQNIRVVRQMDIPRMDFSYELVDASGVVVKSGEQKLKDMAFQDRAINRRTHENLLFEKQMVKRWFKEEFKEELTAKNTL